DHGERGATAVPADLPDVHARRAHLGRLAATGVHEIQAPPFLPRPAHDRVLLRRSRLPDVCRALPPPPVRPRTPRPPHPPPAAQIAPPPDPARPPIGLASPAPSGRYGAQRPAWSRSEANASRDPSGEKRGRRSADGPRVTCRASAPSSAIQILLSGRRSFS